MKNNKLETITHELFGSIRVLDLEGNPWFVAKDIAKALGYSNTRASVSRHCKGVRETQTPSSGGDQVTKILPESDVYRLVMRSKMPKAEDFQDWIVEDVLPKIRKTGRYEQVSEEAQILSVITMLQDRVDQLNLTKAEIGNRREATAMNTASQAVKKVNKLEIELDQSTQYATIKRMEMLYHGQKFQWRELKGISREMGLRPIDVFDANYGTVKAYHAEAWREAYAIEIARRAC